MVLPEDMSDEHRKSRAGQQRFIRSLVGQKVREVRTDRVPGEPEVVAIIVLEDGSELFVTHGWRK